MWPLVSEFLKSAATAFICVLVAGSLLYQVGKHDGRKETQIEAAKEALDRINTLEKNNASFSKLPDRDRCLVFMHDSGLPDSACD